MKEEKRRKLSLRLLRLSSILFGLITLAECVTIVCFAARPKSFDSLVLKSVSANGGADGPTAVYVAAKLSPLPLLPYLFALAPIFTAISLLLISRWKKKGGTGKK